LEVIRTVIIDFFFSDEDDYKDWPRFKSTEQVIISAAVHRRMPLRCDFDDRYLPLFIFERRAERRSKRAYVNVNKRYHAYLVEDGEVKHITFKTYKPFLKALEAELDKTRVVNELTRKTVSLSPYEDIPGITLYQKYFSDETELIERIVKSTIEDRMEMSEICAEVEKVRKAIRLTNAEIEGVKKEIENISKNPEIAVAPDAVVSLVEIEEKIRRRCENFYDRHGNLKQIRHDYYAILKERRKLSANKQDTIHTILHATSPEYRELCAQKNSLEELIKAAVENGGDKIKEEIKRREDKIKELEDRLQSLWRELGELIEVRDSVYVTVESRVRAEIKKSIIPVS